MRQSKIGRLTNAKENIAEPETIDLIDSDEEKTNEVPKSIETTPTPNEGGFHIKLPSTTKSRRKQEQKPQPVKTSIEEAPGSPDDSIVYLDKEELPAKSAKKVKKSAKKVEKKKKSKAADDDVKRVMKNLDMNKDEGQKDSTDEKVEPDQSKDEPEESKDDTEPSKDDPEEPESPQYETVAKSSNKNEMEPMEVEDVPQQIESSVSDQITKLINASGTSSSPVKDLQDMLSDDDALNQSLNTSLNSSINQNSDVKKTPKVLTPKQLARQKEFEERRLEKELARQKEREAKEAQRLKEKEQREEAKRREKEEKEEQRRKEKEEREV